MLIHNAILTGSISLNGSDVSNITGSAEYSASFSSRITNTEATGSTLTSASSSFSTRTTTLEGASGSFSSRVTNLTGQTGSYATTGSNSFKSDQIITGSVSLTGNVTASNALYSGNITAQTLIVQTVTSSVLFSTGSNKIGSTLANVQEITGSLYQTGSVAAFTGNVGIGTNTPSQKLHVFGWSDGAKSRFELYGTGGINEVIQLVNTANYNPNRGVKMGLYVNSGSNANQLGAEIGSAVSDVTSAYLFLSTTNSGTTSEKLRIAADGSVGIGTTSPNGKLTSYGNEIGLQLTFTKDAPSGAYGRLGQDSNGTFLTQNAKYDGTSWTRDNTGGVPMALALHNGNGRYEFRIAANGTNPISWTNALVIESNAAATFASTVTAQSGFKLPANGNGTSPTLAYNNSIGFGVNGTGIFFGNLYNSDLTTAMQFRVSNSGGSDVTSMTLLASGNIGIGITNPSRKFVVSNGGAEGTEISPGSAYTSIISYNRSTSTWIPLVLQEGTGNVLVGTTSDNGYKFNVAGNIYSSGAIYSASSIYGNGGLGGQGLVIDYGYAVALNSNNQTAANGWYMQISTSWSNNFRFFYGGIGVGQGSAKAQIDTSGNYSALSDINKKKDIVLSTLGLNEILQLKPSTFKFKDDENEEEQIGFIAQEVKDVIPHAYYEDAEGDDKFIGLKYNAIVPVLVKAIQELKAEIEILKNR